jgi:hypothetical protein
VMMSRLGSLWSHSSRFASVLITCTGCVVYHPYYPAATLLALPQRRPLARCTKTVHAWRRPRSQPPFSSIVRLDDQDRLLFCLRTL